VNDYPASVQKAVYASLAVFYLQERTLTVSQIAPLRNRRANMFLGYFACVGK
jgi:hypothetical protein